MKRVLYILGLFLSTSIFIFAQDNDSQAEKLGRLQERMREYIQKKLELSKAESEKFAPIFLRYVIDLRRTHNEFRNDRMNLQLKIAEVRLRYRNEFKQVVDEQRANKVFEYQREFEQKVIQEIQDRRGDRPAGKRPGNL